ncbi:hypothetical protein N9C42_01180 [Alphaproteobacteria bacterium]|nr:hypothetical protein [Alphaproteobacteria bacterium]
MINLNIDLTKDDIRVLSLIDYTNDDYLDYGSYFLSVECKSLDLEENFRDAIAEGYATEEGLKSLKTDMQNLLAKIKKAESVSNA